MQKYLLSFLLLFPFLISNAQDELSSKALTITIGAENNQQLYSNSVINEGFVSGAFNSKFSNGYGPQMVLGIGSKKILENGNSQSWSIFGAGSSWDRNDVFNVEDTLGIRIEEISVLIGTVKSYELGLRYDYGLPLTNWANLNLFVGIRGELHGNIISAPATGGVGFDRNANIVSLRTYAVPEIQYVVEDSPYVLSLKLGLPVATVGFDGRRTKNPSLTVAQQKSSGVFFESFSLKGYVVELSLAYFLKSK